MASLLSTERLAQVSARRPWLTVGLWVVLLLVGGFFAAGIGRSLGARGVSQIYVETESQRADRLIAEQLRGAPSAREVVVVQSAGATVDDPAFKALAGGLVADLRALTGQVAAVVSYYESGNQSLVSADRRTLLILVVLRGGVDQERVGPVVDTVHKLDGRDGFTVVTGGESSAARSLLTTSREDLRKGERVTLPIALVILVIVFGALVAAGVPIAMGLTAIVVAVGATALIARAFYISTFALNMILLVGLAVGIDYSLLIVQRFREERGKGLGLDEAITRAGATATRAVLFSGLSVIVALCGLFVVPDSIFRSLAAGAVLVVVAALAAALTLLPAVLRLLGDRLDAARIRLPGRRQRAGEGGAFWSRTTSFVMRHAVLSVIVAVGILVAAAIPYVGIRLGVSGVGSLPRESDAYRAFAILDREFNAGLLSPADIAVSASDVATPPVQAGIERLQGLLRADADFGATVVETNQANSLALVSVPIKGDAESDQAFAALDRLRGQYIPAAFAGTDAEVAVTGSTAKSADYSELINARTPVVFAFVLGLSFITLLIVFRSIVVPVKALIMNLLSVGAAYGLMVLVFQHGVGHRLLGFQQVERIEAWVPLFMFAVLFGLSMDYHVFLLTRIRERFDQTGDNAESVAFGVRTTAGMITGAALIMVAVFYGFARGDLVMFQQMGFGLAVAVILDATIVRTVLVPATMALLGDRNWYLPAWLEWLPRVDIEGSGGPPLPPVARPLEP